MNGNLTMTINWPVGKIPTADELEYMKELFADAVLSATKLEAER